MLFVGVELRESPGPSWVQLQLMLHVNSVDVWALMSLPSREPSGAASGCLLLNHPMWPTLLHVNISEI